MTQIFYFFTFKSSHTDLTDLRDFLPFKSSPGAMKLEASCPQAVPSRKTWRGLWCPANLRAKRFWAPEGGYILPFWREGLVRMWSPPWQRRDGVDRKNWRGGSKKPDGVDRKNLTGWIEDYMATQESLRRDVVKITSPYSKGYVGT